MFRVAATGRTIDLLVERTKATCRSATRHSGSGSRCSHGNLKLQNHDLETQEVRAGEWPA
jgi:hypothetical protein